MSLAVPVRPEHRLDAQLEDGLNEHTEVVAQHLAQGLVDLGRKGPRV